MRLATAPTLGTVYDNLPANARSVIHGAFQAPALAVNVEPLVYE